MSIKYKENKNFNFFLLFISFIIAMYLIEVSLFVYESFFVKQRGFMSKSEYARDFNQQQIFHKLATQQKTYLAGNNEKIYPARSPNLSNRNDEFIPLGTIPNTTNLLCNESGKWSTFKSDLYGFNNRNEQWRSESIVFEKSEATARDHGSSNSQKKYYSDKGAKHITRNALWSDQSKSYSIFGPTTDQLKTLLVGDSYVQGACVDQQNNISNQLTRLTKIYPLDRGENIISLSNSGIGPLIELALLMEFGRHANPKKIIWFYYEGNDFIDLKNELNHPRIFSYLSASLLQNLVEKEERVNNYFSVFLSEQSLQQKNLSKNFVKLLNIVKFKNLRNYLITFKNIYLPFHEEDLLTFNLIFERAVFIAEQLNSELYFVYLPSYLRYSTINLPNIDKFNKNKIIKIIENTNIQVIDIDKILLNKINYKEFFPNGEFGHFNEKGYFHISKIIYEKIFNSN